MTSHSPYCSQEPSYSFEEDYDFQDISLNMFTNIITEAFDPEGQSPTTWTSPRGILTPTSSHDLQHERIDVEGGFSPQTQHGPSQNEVLAHLTAISPTISLDTSFEISSDDEMTQDVSQDELYQAMRTTQMQQRYQNSSGQFPGGLFRDAGSDTAAIDHTILNAMVNGMDTQLTWRNNFGSPAEGCSASLFQSTGDIGFSTQAQTLQFLAQYHKTPVGVPTFNSSSDSAATIVPDSHIRSQRSDSPWSPLGVPPHTVPEGSHLPDASWLGSNMQQMYRPPGSHLAPRIPQTNTSSFTNSSPRAALVAPTKKGGRRNGKLESDVRKNAAAMRNHKGCWVCGIRRENCDLGSPCKRCIMISQRGQAHHLGCDRRHLKDMLSSFLPEKMSPLKQYIQIESFVKNNIRTLLGNMIPVDLTIGCGPCLSLVLYEFQPTHEHFLFTSGYIADENGIWHRQPKRSPPLAVQQSPKEVKETLQKFVNDMVSKYILDFQDMSCDGEDSFLPNLLRLLCSLYIGLGPAPQNRVLREDVHMVLMMLVLTHIIGHAITIERDSQASVVTRLSRHNDPNLYQEWTSPRMANVQLKQVFGEIRDMIMTRTLNRLHQILRSAKDKNRTWLSSFVIMLGISMVSEEYQHLLHIQVDHYVSHGEKDRATAEWDARDGCKQIDEGLEFLQQLFHYKYRPKHQTKARFAGWSGKTFHQAEATFVHSLEDLAADEKADYLLSRKDLQINSMAEGNHSARLVAKFLADFMELEPRSP